MSFFKPLLLPGNMCDERLWTSEIRQLLPRAVDIDLSQDLTMEAMAQRALGSTDGPLLPVGFSMGAIVALAIAAIVPDRLAGLVLLNVNAGADLPERATVRPRQQADVRAGKLEAVVVDELKPNYLAAANRDNAPLLQLLREMAIELGPDVFVRQSEALRTRADYRAVATRLTCPILLACGAEDRLCPPDWHRALASTLQRPTLHLIENAGHMLPLEQPVELADRLNAWLEIL